MLIPIEWGILRKTGINIVEFYAICNMKEFESIAIFEASEIIDLADFFQGIPIDHIPETHVKCKWKTTVSFSIIFPTEKEAKKFKEFLDEYYFV